MKALKAQTNEPWHYRSPRLVGKLLLLLVLSPFFSGCRLLECRRNGDVAPLYSDSAPEVVQVLSWGEVQKTRPAPADTMFATTGRRLYVIGDIDGGFRPRSNPYDLYNFGAPLPSDPLADELQGVWAQPVKALDGYLFVVEVNGKQWPLLDAQRFTQTFVGVQFDYQKGPLQAIRQDFVPQDRPLLFTTLTLQNDGTEKVEVSLSFLSYFDLEDAWFTSLAERRNRGESVQAVGDQIVAQANSAPGAWAVAVSGALPPAEVKVAQGSNGLRVGHLAYTARLEPGVPQSWTFAVVIETESGPDAAIEHLNEWLPQRERLFAEKQALYETLLTAGPRFRSPDARFNAAFDIARANMQMLEAESPGLGRYFYAGLEMFPFWFGADSYYSAPGLLASNLAATTKTQVLIGAQLRESGRIPHQVSPAGHTAFPGNIQETSQWVMAVWDTYRWTGDHEFLTAAYAAAVEGLLDYTLNNADDDGDRYPEGPGMVEKTGMGLEKVDSACYLWAALLDLAQMAEAVGDTETVAHAEQVAADLQARFDADWWIPEQSVYADSLQNSGNTLLYAGHWTAAVPLEVGIAPVEHARASLDRFQRDYLNQWGLVHTRGDDERVWTLPTATLSRGAYRYGDPELGLTMLQHLAKTLNHGGIGLLHELIPDGLSLLQLWSGATFVRGVVEDLMGITVRADLHEVTIAPALAAGWDFAELEDLHFGGHTITVRAMDSGIIVTHTSGPAPLSITYRAPYGEDRAFTLNPGEVFTVNE